jgi:hypothetical protein
MQSIDDDDDMLSAMARERSRGMGLEKWPTLYGKPSTQNIRSKINGHPFRSSFMAMGNGTHKLPVRADIRQAIGKDVGDIVVISLETGQRNSSNN